MRMSSRLLQKTCDRVGIAVAGDPAQPLTDRPGRCHIANVPAKGQVDPAKAINA